MNQKITSTKMLEEISPNTDLRLIPFRSDATYIHANLQYNHSE